MSRIIHSAGNMSPTVRTGHRMAEVVAAMVPPPEISGDDPVPPQTKSEGVMSYLPGAIGAGAGFLVGSRMKHPVLGALLGHAAGASAYRYLQGGKTRALCQLGVECTGIAGALMLRKSPIVGWVAGIVVGSMATYFVPGSPCRDEWRKLKR